MKRKLSFIGFVLETILLSCFTIFFIDIFAQLLAFLDNYLPEIVSFIVLTVVQILAIIVALVLNAVSINTWDNLEKFNKKKPVIVVAMIFNFIAIAIYIILLATLLNTTVSITYTIITLVLSVGANTLIIIDFAKSTKKISALNNEVLIKKEKNSEEIVEENAFVLKVKQLEKLKEEKSITENEFDILKSNAIKEELKNKKEEK